jgi:hypothetical protein
LSERLVPARSLALLAKHPAHQVGAVFRTKLLHDVGAVKLNGARADAKRAGGLLAGCTPNASLASVSVIGSEMAHTQNSLLFNPASK